MSTRAALSTSRSAWPRTSGIERLTSICEQGSKHAVSSCRCSGQEQAMRHWQDQARLRLR